MLDQNKLDWLGIHATHINAHLLTQVFDEFANQEILKNPNKKIAWSRPILIGGGWKPGWSTDYVSVLMAENTNAKTVINLSNIDAVYDKDPKKYKKAKKIKKISWPDFKKIVGGRWVPGAHLPFDPIASRLAEKSKLRVIVMNGHKLSELEKALKNEEFKGTLIG